MAEYEQCRLLLVDKKISTARDFINILEGALRAGYPIMIMAEDIEQEPLATLVVNKLRGALKVKSFWVFKGCAEAANGVAHWERNWLQLSSGLQTKAFCCDQARWAVLLLWWQ